MNVTIQKMTKEHLQEIKDKLVDEFDEFWNASVLEKELENPFSNYIVALEEKEVVGYAGLWVPLDEGHITNIVTKKEKRGNQIATQMLETLIEMAKQQNLQSLTLEVNVHNTIAIHLYQKYQFKEVGRRKKYYNSMDDALIMTLNLQILEES